MSLPQKALALIFLLSLGKACALNTSIPFSTQCADDRVCSAKYVTALTALGIIGTGVSNNLRHYLEKQALSKEAFALEVKKRGAMLVNTKDLSTMMHAYDIDENTNFSLPQNDLTDLNEQNTQLTQKIKKYRQKHPLQNEDGLIKKFFKGNLITSLDDNIVTYALKPI